MASSPVTDTNGCVTMASSPVTDTNSSAEFGMSFNILKKEICYEFVDKETKDNLIFCDDDIIYEKSLPSKFGLPIPFRTNATPLQVDKSLICIPIKTKEKTTITEVSQHSSLFILFAISCQRGPQTGCPYQVPVNCRDLSMHHLVNTNDGNNLMESASNSSLQNSFGEGDLSALTFFGVEDANVNLDAVSCDFHMPSMMNLVDNKGEFRVQDAVLRGRKAVCVSAVHFKRACRFFNRVWGEIDENGNIHEHPDDDPVTSRDLHAFAMLFKNHRLDTEDGWAYFLEDFQLQNLFPYEKDVHVLVQIRRLGEYYRALVPLDIGVSRGQHRCHAMAFLGMGYFDCVRAVPLPCFSGGTYLFNMYLLRI